MMTAEVKVETKRDLKAFHQELVALSNNRVLVGVPEENNGRQEGKVGNAQLAMIHDKGSPVASIPARPFMIPGIKKAQRFIDKELRQAAQASLDGDKSAMTQALKRAGFWAQLSIQDVISEGKGFAPLKRSTLLARLSKRKYLWKKYHRPGMKEKKEEFLSSLKPLQDTLEMLKSITYVVQETKG